MPAYRAAWLIVTVAVGAFGGVVALLNDSPEVSAVGAASIGFAGGVVTTSFKKSGHFMATAVQSFTSFTRASEGVMIEL